jgi:hypothetical protein
MRFCTSTSLAHLAQTEATVEWAIRELQREGDATENHESLFRALARLLCNSDPRFLVPRAQVIIQAQGFSKDLIPDLQEQLQLATWDADQCWQELERICTARMRKALARKGGTYVERILELLGQKVEDFENDPMVWLEEFLVMLAGEMRLELAIPLIVKKLHIVDEFLSEACVEALGKIGTDAAAEAVAEGWLEAEWEYRLYATSALGKIHSDTTVRKCLELLPQDKDLAIRTKLADALLGQFADEGIEPVREIVQKRGYDSFSRDLMSRLVAVSTVLGSPSPNMRPGRERPMRNWPRRSAE